MKVTSFHEISECHCIYMDKELSLGHMIKVAERKEVSCFSGFLVKVVLFYPCIQRYGKVEKHLKAVS